MDEKQIIQQIFELNDDEIEEFIEKRIQFLEENATEDRERVSPADIAFSRGLKRRECSEILGYIPKKVEIQKSTMDIAAFILDDKSFYKTLIDCLRKKPENIKVEDKINHNSIIMMIQRIIISYFGLKANDSARNALYDSKSDFEDNLLSISDFKNNQTGMCVERSAVAQNILSFLGYNPMMIYGYASNTRDGMNVSHVFNCIIRNGKGKLIDFTNPIYKDGRFFKPAIFSINNENLQAFMRGKGEIEVQHKNLYQEDGIEKEDVVPWVYSSDEIDPKYFDNPSKNSSDVITPSQIGQATVKTDTGITDINQFSQGLKKNLESDKDKKNKLID